MDGHFSGDPHPVGWVVGNYTAAAPRPSPPPQHHQGNILITPREPAEDDNSDPQHPRPARIVLLDWGLAKTLDDSMRLAFCRMALGAKTLDFGEMLQAYVGGGGGGGGRGVIDGLH